MSTIVIHHHSDAFKTSGDRIDIRKDGSVRVYQQLESGRWRCVGAVKPFCWHQIVMQPEPEPSA